MTHYNEFTIKYIESIKKNLKIEVNENNESVYFPELITNENISNLKMEIESLWHLSDNAIEVIKTKRDAKVQSGLFGLINDLELALKTGFLMGDRIVLLDYLFDRILSRKKPENINRLQLGSIVNPLVALLPLAKTGRIVIIPSPFIWNPETKNIIREVAENSTISMGLISMLNMLSICKLCHLHPYTIAESQKEYDQIINNQIDHVDIIGKDGSQFAYEGILCSLLSERLLNETTLSYIRNIPIEKYVSIISQNSTFYSEYLSYITSGGSLSADINIEKIRTSLIKEIENRNKITFRDVAKGTNVLGGIGGGAIALLGAATVISAPVAITGAFLALSATLSGILTSSNTKENIIISLFNDLNNA